MTSTTTTNSDRDLGDRKQKAISVMLYNVQSIRSIQKRLTFDELITDTGIDVIAVTESWLTAAIPEGAVNFTQYDIVARQDRDSLTWGGE